MIGYHVAASFPGGEPHARPQLAYLTRMLKRFWSLRSIGSVRDSVVITHGNIWYLLTDNGGEINICKINDWTISVPYEQNAGRVPIGRVAWFCALTIFGDPIPDYGPNASVDDLTLESND